MQQKIIFLFFSFLALSTRAAATTTVDNNPDLVLY
jgi:hypothetical protein